MAEIDKYIDAMSNPLTECQMVFAEHYLETFDVNASYRKAYKATGYNRQITHKGVGVLQQKAVKEYIDLRRTDMRNALCIDGERVAAELAACAFTNISDLVEWNGDDVTLIPKSKMTLAQKKSIKKIKVTKTPTEHGTKTVMELEVHDKLKAIDMLQKNLGITHEPGAVTNNFQQNIITLNPGDMSDEELQEVLHNATTAVKEDKPTVKPAAIPEPEFFDQPVDVMHSQSESILSILDED